MTGSLYEWGRGRRVKEGYVMMEVGVRERELKTLCCWLEGGKRCHEFMNAGGL